MRLVYATLGLVLTIALSGCAAAKPKAEIPASTWELWTTRGAGGVVVGTFDEALCSDMVEEFRSVTPCRRVRVTSDPRGSAPTLWLARFQVTKSAGADGPELMMGHASEASCLLVLERAMVRGMVLLADCKPLSLAPVSGER